MKYYLFIIVQTILLKPIFPSIEVMIKHKNKKSAFEINFSVNTFDET